MLSALFARDGATVVGLLLAGVVELVPVQVQVDALLALVPLGSRVVSHQVALGIRHSKLKRNQKVFVRYINSTWRKTTLTKCCAGFLVLVLCVKFLEDILAIYVHTVRFLQVRIEAFHV